MTPALRKTIHEAMARFADGDRAAIQVLLDELWPVIVSFAGRSVRNEHDAEDIAQEVFLRICARVAEFDRSRDAVSWVFGIAGYEVMTHRRRAQRRREASDSELQDSADRTAPQDELLMQEELMAALTDALGELTHEDRAVLEKNIPSAAVVLPGATMRKRRQRALSRLRNAFRSLYGEP